MQIEIPEQAAVIVLMWREPYMEDHLIRAFPAKAGLGVTTSVSMLIKIIKEEFYKNSRFDFVMVTFYRLGGIEMDELCVFSREGALKDA